MSLRWEWNERCGSAKIRSKEGDEWEVNLYEGNAFLIMLYEWQQDGQHYHQLYNFFADEEHCKNMLGLNPKKGYKDNLFTELKEITIIKSKYRYTDKLVKCLAKAYDEIDIHIR